MKSATAALLLALAVLPVYAEEHPVVTVPSVLMKDTYAGLFESADAEVHFEFFVGASTKFTVKVEGETDDEAPALALRLFGPDGNEIVVTGTNKDKSKPQKNRVEWKNVKLEQTGRHRFELGADGPGAWSLRLDGNPKDVIDVTESNEPLAAGEEAAVDFVGLAGGRVAGTIKAPGKKNKLKGEFTRVVEPDGNVLSASDLDESGRLFLRQDGDHQVFFRNIGKEAGDWKVQVKARTPSLKRRKGLVDGDGVTWKPKVEKVQPKKAFHLETALRLVLTGRDLQKGLDVRLTKNSHETDILGTEIDYISDTEVHFTINLDTTASADGRSVGNWKVGVWNDPQYAVDGDRTTLDKSSVTVDDSFKFKSLSDGDIALPRGTENETEVFVLEFAGGFQNDIERMGFGSTDSVVANSARQRLEEYIILYVRHLFLVNETLGRVGSSAVPLCFVRGSVPGVAGSAGDAYNVLQVGGEMEASDPRDPQESLDWGFVPFDAGNSARGVFRQKLDDGTRVGLGVRLRFLNPALPEASASWIEATLPLLGEALTFDDRRYYQSGYFPYTIDEAERMEEIVLQTERVAREIAAVVAHHIAKAIGTDSGGSGPTANPTVAGEMYVDRTSLFFDDADIVDMVGRAVPHGMPGKADRLTIPWFTLATTQEFRLPDALTDEEYFGPFALFGGRPNARNNELKAGYHSSSDKPPGMELRIQGIQGTSPLYLNGRVVCGIYNLRIRFTDTKHDVSSSIRWQTRLFADVDKLRPDDRREAEFCNDAIDRE